MGFSQAAALRTQPLYIYVRYWSSKTKLLADHLFKKTKKKALILTLYPDLELAALSEPAFDNAGLARRQHNLQPHKELEVRLLLEQVATDHSVIISHLSTRERETALGDGYVSSKCDKHD